jgi:SAM-dependent methyltransferase
MESTTNWERLWRELVEIKLGRRPRDPNGGPGKDVWQDRAREFDANVKRRWATPDSTREFVTAQLNSGATALDIGAGTGAWTCLLARHAGHVTAVEPSTAMIEVMRENLAVSQCANVEVVQGPWPDTAVGVHDYAFCSHAMYTSPDLPAFVRRMMAVSRRMCFLLMRVPTPNNVLSQAAQHIWGQPHDSPNFVIAYNILVQMGIRPNVLMENTGVWIGETSNTLEEALSQTKRHFGLEHNPEHDAYLMDLLRHRLVFRDDKYVWPPSVQSGLLYWRVDAGHHMALSNELVA